MAIGTRRGAKLRPPLPLLVLLVALAAFAVSAWAAEPAAAARLITIDTPSKHVDPADPDVKFNGSDHPGELRANVLLPDRYRRHKRRLPVLYLLHGVGDNFATWSSPDRGRIREIARGFGAIIVMPEADTGFYSNWWNDGRRGEPGWERFYLEELIPQVERRFRIRRARRWHAVAGLSMGGFGASFLATQVPGYFGSVASFSGFVQHQRPEIGLGLGPATGQSYEDMFGPVDGFYATGHNPTPLAANLRHSRLYVVTGNGVPEPGVESAPAALTVGGLIEAELRLQNDEFAAAAREAGADLTYRVLNGVHDWPYWRRHLRDAIGWGLFRRVRKAPRRWSYRTVARKGQAWGLRYRFAQQPPQVQGLRRDGDRLRGAGSGRVRIRNAAGCGFTAELPFNRPWPGRRCR